MTYRMDPKYGAPVDLQVIDADLMFDFVLNHLSAKGEWFAKYLAGEDPYDGYFVEADPAADVSGVIYDAQQESRVAQLQPSNLPKRRATKTCTRGSKAP